MSVYNVRKFLFLFELVRAAIRINIYIIFVAGTVLSTLYVLAHFVLTLALQATYYYPHLPDADTKQRI